MAEFEDENIVNMNEANEIELHPGPAGKFVLKVGESKCIRGNEYNADLPSSLQYNVPVQKGFLYRIYMKMNESFVFVGQMGGRNSGQSANVVVYPVEGDEFSFGVISGDYFQLIVPMGRHITVNTSFTPYIPITPVKFNVGSGEVKVLNISNGSQYLIRGMMEATSPSVYPGVVTVSFEVADRAAPVVDQTMVRDTYYTIRHGETYECPLKVKQQRKICSSVGEPSQPFIINVRVPQRYILFAQETQQFVLRAFGNIGDQETAKVTISCTNDQKHMILASPNEETYVIIQDIQKRIQVRREEDVEQSEENLNSNFVTVYPGRVTHVNAELGNRYLVMLDDLKHLRSPKIINPGQVRITAYTDSNQ